MNLSVFIAKRIAFSNTKATFSKFIIRLATLATALSVAIMIIAVAIVLGFKSTIKNKLYEFWGSIQIAPYIPDPTSLSLSEPFDADPQLVAKIKLINGVTDIQPFALRPGILNTGQTMQGIQLKGIESTYPLNTNAGTTYTGQGIKFVSNGYSQEVMLPQTMCNKLNASIGDTLTLIFVDAAQEHPRIRKLKINGTYNTGIENIDQAFVLCDINLLRRLSNWTEHSINGYQISLANPEDADSISHQIYQQLLQPPMQAIPLHKVYPSLIAWLSLMDTNAWLILGIMAIVAVINLATALLIFVLERTNMIGIIKALGMSSAAIQKIFLYHAALVAIKGVLWGSILGVACCLLQQYTHFITLDETAYYMSYAPIQLVAWHVLAIDIGTILFCFFILIIPALLVNRINIVKAIRFK